MSAKLEQSSQISIHIKKVGTNKDGKIWMRIFLHIYLKKDCMPAIFIFA
jgi:hypothetical protein